MENVKFDPHHRKTREPVVTKICKGDYIPDIFRDAKFQYDPIMEFCPHICEIDTLWKMFVNVSPLRRCIHVCIIQVIRSDGQNRKS